MGRGGGGGSKEGAAGGGGVVQGGREGVGVDVAGGSAEVDENDSR